MFITKQTLIEPLRFLILFIFIDLVAFVVYKNVFCKSNVDLNQISSNIILIVKP